MSRHPTLRLCLEPSLLKSAAAGEHNFVNLIVQSVKKSRFRVEFCPDTEAELFKSTLPDVYTLSHMKQPPSGRGLVFRRAYEYPFWQIDATAARWDWDVARATFDPEAVPRAAADKFLGFWQKRLFGAAPQDTSRGGYIYVPLQGRLSVHRTFQTCAPIEMLNHVLRHSGGRKVIATLHPRETYTPADYAVLEQMENRHTALQVTTGDMVAHLQHCDFVVTQNSSAAFSGYFFGKPALLFAGIDFHHIAVKADMEDLAHSFAQVAAAAPDYAGYLWWFWQEQSINAGRDGAVDKIAARLRRFGWPID